MVDGSELAFRDLTRRYGVHLAYTPMLNAKIFARDAKYRAENFTTHALDRPLAAQFCANDAALLVEAARLVQHCVDAVDLNLGCPQGIARKGHYGAFLQDEWELVGQIVGKAARELEVPIWCKIRVFGSVEKTVAYARMLERAGAGLIAVHGRTREQKGKMAGFADWGMIAAVKRAVGIPVVANGNVKSMDDAMEALRVTGADGVMSAWALLDHPAVFVGRGGPSRMEVCREYLELARKYGTPMRMVRLHVFKMMRGRLDVNMDLNEEVAKCKRLDEFERVLDLLEPRTDFGGMSFEHRVVRGEVVENVVSVKRERLRRRMNGCGEVDER